MQYIIICLKDSTPDDQKTFVQATRQRFLTIDEAEHRTEMYSPERQATVVSVPSVKINDLGYPVYNKTY